MMHNEITHLWQTFHDRLHQFVRQRVQNPADAEDIVQEIFLRIHQRLSTLKERDRLIPWMFQIARNAVIDYYRSPLRRREIPMADEVEQQLNDFQDDNASDNSLSLNRELAACLRPLLANLPDTYRIPLEWVELQGMSQRAVASQLGLTISGAKSRVQRGRQKLKALLLQCCQVQLDRVGNVMNYKIRTAGCHTNKSEQPCCQ
jgi:RNA polymerase sigma-70 factor, ECF subfamily